MLFWALGRRRLSIIVAVIAVLSFALREFGWRHYTTATFYLAPTRAWELMIGALAAFACFRQPVHRRTGATLNQILAVAGLALIVFATLAFDDTTPFPSAYALVPTVGAVLIILFATARTVVGRVLSLPVFVGPGLISYSAYLWHQPLFAFARIRSLNAPNPWTMAALSALALVLAYFTWRFVEIPFRNRQSFSARRVFSGAGAVMASLIVFGAIGCFTKGFEARMPQAAVAALSVVEHHDDWSENGCNIRRGYRAPEVSCLLGDKKAAPSVAIWGDSHAEALTEAFGKAIRRLGKSAYQFTANACLPVLNVRTAGTPERIDCEHIEESTAEFLKRQQKTETIVLVARWTAYLAGSKFDNREGGVTDDSLYAVPTSGFDDEKQRVQKVATAIVSEVKALLAAGKKVILVYPIPEVGWHVPELEAKIIFLSGGKNAEISTSYEVQKERSARASAVLDAIGKHPGLVRIRPDKIFCNSFIEKRCAASIDGVPLYYDHNHVSVAGANLIVKEIAKHL